jgi:Tfp pilus assembly PilM family ATPase
VDFDSDRVRIVYADASPDAVRILKLASAAMPDGLDLQDPRAVGDFLGRALREAKVGGAGILMNVPRAQAVLKPLTLPPAASEAELAAMVQYQVAKELPLRPEEAAVDFAMERHYDAAGLHPGVAGVAKPAPGARETPEAPGLDVLVAAVRRSVVEYYRQIAAGAGVRLLRLGLRPYADLRAVQAYADIAMAEPVAILHLTADEVEINIAVGSSLVFSRSAVVPIGPRPGRSAPQDPAAPPAHDPIYTAVMEVARSLRTYQSLQRGRQVGTIILAGGTGIEEPLAEELRHHLRLECIRFDPGPALGLAEAGAKKTPGVFSAPHPSGPSGTRHRESFSPPETAGFISALGLAAGHARTDALPYDFLHPKRPPVERNRARQLGIAGGAAAAAILLAAVISAVVVLRGRGVEVRGLQGQLADLKQEAKAVEALGAAVRAVEKWDAGRRRWLDHWARLSGCFPSCEDVYVTGIEVAPDGSLNFAVRASTTDVLERLGERLDAAGYAFRPGPVTTIKNDLRYQVSTNVRVLVDPTMAVDLASVQAEPRPSDDMSAELLAAGRDWRKAEEEAGTARPAVVRPAESTGAPAAPAAPPAGPAGATPEDRELARTLLEKYDENHDGRLSYREAYSARRAIYREPAPPWDKDGDGRLSPEEYATLRRIMGTVQSGG